ncbi:MAG: hypothetical protein N2490_05355 [Ignavibacteria bacterium]|nr:hypothetical protein [Ignavibacteria bacterium]
MHLKNNTYLYVLLVLLFIFLFNCSNKKELQPEKSKDDTTKKLKDSLINNKQLSDTLVLSFLGNEKRNFYGNTPPQKLDIIWKCYIGGGKSNMPTKNGQENFHYGAGWTGQPLLFKEKEKFYLIQGSYDHNLRKIDAITGEVIWKYKFDDAIKGTGTIWYNNYPRNEEESIIILQGSRQGVNLSLHSKYIYSYRGISAISGKEIYRINVEKTPSYSRDVDGSALIVNDTAYIGLENGIFIVFNPDPSKAKKVESHFEPEIIQKLRLYSNEDVSKRGGQIIIESSPSLIGRDIYISAGSGYVFKYNIDEKKIIWQYYIGSDLDGSCVVTSDSCILIAVEKQFIQGKGGMLKINPRKKPIDCVEWFFPTLDRNLSSWKGGIIGSAGINDNYIKNTNLNKLASFAAIDGNLYVVNYTKLDSSEKVKGYDNKTLFYKPELIYKYNIGSSISTPIFFKDKLIVCSYSGIYLFQYNDSFEFSLLEKRNLTFEATPIVWNEKLYVAAKDGYLYCFGEKKP